MQSWAACSTVIVFLLVLWGIEPVSKLFLKFEPVIVPGQNRVIASSGSSICKASKKPFTANLVEQYGALNGSASIPLIELITTI